MAKSDKRFGLRDALTFILPELRPRVSVLWALAGLVLVASFCPLLSPLLQRSFVDRITARDFSGAVWMLAGIALLTLLSGGVDTTSSFLISRTQIGINASLRQRMFRSLLGLPVERISGLGGGYLSGRLQSDVAFIGYLYSGAAYSGVRNLIALTGTTVLIASLDWRALLILLPILPVYWVLVRYFGRKQFALAMGRCEQDARNSRSVYDAFRNIQLVKSRNGERESGARFQTGLKASRQLQFQQIRMESFFRVGLLVLPGFSYLALFVFGIKMIADGSWTLGLLWAMNCYFHQLFAPMRSLSSTLVTVSQSLAAAERLSELSALDAEGDQGEAVPSLRGDIEIEGLDYAYPGGKPLFNGLNLTISTGEHVVITGPSGRGKSTLIELLLRLRRPTCGVIRIGGRDIQDYRPSGCRKRIGFIGQISEFFAGTLRENLQCGLDSIPSEERLAEVIASVGLAERLPQGGAEKVSEGGVNFSPGEKVRLSLARELLREVDLLLMDEPTASLDAENEESFLRLVEQTFADRTVIAVSHREGTVARFKRVISLNAAPEELHG